MRDKKTLLLLGGLALFALILLIIAFMNALGKNTPSSETVPSVTTVPSPIPSPVSKAPIPYNDAASEKMLQSLKEREPLSEKDLQTKNTLLATLGQRSGTIHTTNTYAITYLQAADVIQVEVRTPNIVLAKTEAAAWLMSQGFSKKAICTLPIVFYLNFSVAQSVKDTDVIFNPIAEGC